MGAVQLSQAVAEAIKNIRTLHDDVPLAVSQLEAAAIKAREGTGTKWTSREDKLSQAAARVAKAQALAIAEA